MTSRPGAPAVVPAGRLAAGDQPVLPLAGEPELPVPPPAGELELRPWRLDDADADALLAAGRDPDISHWNLFSVAGRAEACERIERMHQRRAAETGAVWAVAPLGGAAVGLAGLNDVDLAGGSAEVVYWVLPAARGGGIAVRAARRLGRWALDELGLRRVTLRHSTANPASCRVAEKAGYAFVATQRGALEHADGRHDVHVHALAAG
ncbi:GNAT family N-acetyltransferase [Streptomyces sp. NPDC014684]|uniref:GNAT family N-acetyltransferase n=1 Tax=Streptomyces sp. NPDC014684 TaxID=3364880 RepID=UPI0036F7687F